MPCFRELEADIKEDFLVRIGQMFDVDKLSSTMLRSQAVSKRMPLFTIVYCQNNICTYIIAGCLTDMTLNQMPICLTSTLKGTFYSWDILQPAF